MTYIKRCVKGETLATFTTGAMTSCHDVACFFLTMQDKGVSPAELDGYIRIEQLTSGDSEELAEIRRVAATFTNAKGAAA